MGASLSSAPPSDVVVACPSRPRRAPTIRHLARHRRLRAQNVMRSGGFRGRPPPLVGPELHQPRQRPHMVPRRPTSVRHPIRHDSRHRSLHGLRVKAVLTGAQQSPTLFRQFVESPCDIGASGPRDRRATGRLADFEVPNRTDERSCPTISVLLAPRRERKHAHPPPL